MFVAVRTAGSSEMAWQIPMLSLCADREAAKVTWSKKRDGRWFLGNTLSRLLERTIVGTTSV